MPLPLTKIINDRIKRIFDHHGSYPQHILDTLQNGKMGLVVIVKKGYRIKKELASLVMFGDDLDENGLLEQTRLGKVVLVTSMISIQQVDIVKMHNSMPSNLTLSQTAEYDSLSTVKTLEQCVKMVTSLPSTWLKLNNKSIIPKFSYLRTLENTMNAERMFLGYKNTITINETLLEWIPLLPNAPLVKIAEEDKIWDQYQSKWNELQLRNAEQPVTQDDFVELYRMLQEFANQVRTSLIKLKTPQGVTSNFYVVGTFSGVIKCDGADFSALVQKLALLSITQLSYQITPFLYFKSDQHAKSKKYTITMTPAKPGRAMWTQEVDLVSMLNFRFSWKDDLVVIGSKGSMKTTVVELLNALPEYQDSYTFQDSDEYWKWVTLKKWESNDEDERLVFEKAANRMKNAAKDDEVKSLMLATLAESPYYNILLLSEPLTVKNPLLQQGPSEFAKLATKLTAILEDSVYGYTAFCINTGNDNDQRQKIYFTHSSIEATYMNPKNQQIRIQPPIPGRWRMQETLRPNSRIEQWALEVFEVMDQRQCHTSWIDFLLVVAPESIVLLTKQVQEMASRCGSVGTVSDAFD